LSHFATGTFTVGVMTNLKSSIPAVSNNAPIVLRKLDTYVKPPGRTQHRISSPDRAFSAAQRLSRDSSFGLPK
jgi:hypothetical protein